MRAEEGRGYFLENSRIFGKGNCMSGAEGTLSLGIRCEQQATDGKGERK